MAGAAAVGASQDLPALGAGRQLEEGGGQHLFVIDHRVGAGVARAQDRGQSLTTLVQVAGQGMEAEAALEGRCRLLLLGVGGDQGGVEVEHDLLGRRASSPGLLTHLAVSLLDDLEVGLGHGVDHAPSGRRRATLPNRSG